MPRTGRVIWTLLFGKGGAGKTSTVVALAGVAFAHGSIFVVIHTDPQADALRWLGSGLVVHEPHATVQTIRRLAKARQLVIVDCPPGLGEGVVGPVKAADFVVAVHRPVLG